tara:strand:- start:1708 stop:2202 length:495 start_codon:yes stop_codon:yes gene_type:complete
VVTERSEFEGEDFNSAAADLERAIEVCNRRGYEGTKGPLYYSYELALVSWKAGNDEVALRAVDDAIALCKLDNRLLTAAAEIHLRQGNLQEALIRISLVIAMDQDELSYNYHILGEIERQLGDEERASKSFVERDRLRAEELEVIREDPDEDTLWWVPNIPWES